MKNFVLLLLGAALLIPSASRAAVKALTVDALDWDVPPWKLIYWNWKGNVIRNTSGGTYVVHRNAPFAANYTAEVTVKPVETRSVSRSEAAVALVSYAQSNDNRRGWHLSLVEENKKRFVDIMLFDKTNPDLENTLITKVDTGSDFQWEHNKHYRLQLKVDGSNASGKVFDEDGKVLWSGSARMAEKTAPFPVKFAIFTTALCSEFSNPCAEWKNLVKIKPLAVSKRTPEYKSAANVLKSYSSKATGFFRVEQDKTGRWHFIDPNGKAMFACGIDRFYMGGRFCEALGYSPYKKFVTEKFGCWENWAKSTRKRVDSWGFNYASTADEKFYDNFPFSINLCVGSSFATFGDEYDICPYLGHVGSALPNPFHPRFAEWAKTCYLYWAESDIDNPYYVGYFCDNELRWRGANYNPNGTGVFDTVLAKNSSHTAKIALAGFLKKHFKADINSFNSFWGTKLENFDAILDLKDLPHKNERHIAVKRAFLELVAEKYYSTIGKALREVDPNHLFMGNRYAGTHSAPREVWKMAGKYCDVVTFNQYPLLDFERNELMLGNTPLKGEFDRMAEICKRPMMITEWSYLAFDSGLNNRRGAGQRLNTQQERTIAAEAFLRQVLDMPYMIGMCWYQFTDDPKLGVRKMHPESCNYGLVNEQDEPYQELTAMFSRVQKDIDASRAEGFKSMLPLNAAGALYKHFDSPMVPKGSVDGLMLEMKRDGSFTVANKDLTIRHNGRDGNLEFWCNGRKIGTYYVVLKGNLAGNARLAYPIAKSLSNIKTRYTDNGVVVEFTSLCVRGKDNFEADCRFLLPAEGNWIMMDIVEVRNLCKSSFDMKGFLMQVPPAFKADLSSCREFIGSHIVKKDCWYDDKGNYFGGTASFGWFNFHYFWGSNKKYHPDALHGTEAMMMPGKSFRPRTPAYCFFYAGTDGKRHTIAQELVKRDMSEVHLVKRGEK